MPAAQKKTLTIAPAPATNDDRRCWLLKSEPTCYALADLARDGTTGWGGIRNYQARNLLRDEMKTGDYALFYHSSAEPPGVAGLCRIAGPARPDPTQFDPADDHFDPRSTKESPVWLEIPVAFVAAFPKFVPLALLKATAALAGLMVLQKGSRLSVQPVPAAHFALICRLGGMAAP